VYKLVAFELRVVQKFLVAAVDRADEEPLSMRHLMFSERTVVRENLVTVFYMTKVHFLTITPP
jgi:hypothetical protein